MVPRRHVFLLILLTYVSMINVFIVSVVYNKYTLRMQSAPHAPVAKAPPPGTPSPEARGLAGSAQSACVASRSTLVLVMSAAPERTSNHALAVAGTHLLTTVHQSLAHHKSASYSVRLVVSPDEFLSMHRLWCRALVGDTAGRCTCALDVTADLQPSSVLLSVLRADPCTRHVVLLPSSIHLLPNFLQTLAALDPVAVYCLARPLLDPQAGPLARNRSLGPTVPACSADAFSMPRTYIARHSAHHDHDIPAHASRLHMFAGVRAVAWV